LENGQLPESAVSRSAMSKVFWRILPLIALAYLFAYMDRVNVSFAAAQMNDDLKFSATIYGLGGGLFFWAMPCSRSRPTSCSSGSARGNGSHGS